MTVLVCHSRCRPPAWVSRSCNFVRQPSARGCRSGPGITAGPSYPLNALNRRSDVAATVGVSDRLVGNGNDFKRMQHHGDVLDLENRVKTRIGDLVDLDFPHERDHNTATVAVEQSRLDNYDKGNGVFLNPLRGLSNSTFTKN